jgi:succinate dehydrogenase / fumarate reductase, cytochrome b subunit
VHDAVGTRLFILTVVPGLPTMKPFTSYFSSSVGRKLLMGLSGLFLCSFLVIHLAINLFLFKSDEGRTFDVYAEFMATYPFIRPLEIVLFAGFLLHALIGTMLWLANRRARPVPYAANKPGENSSLVSRLAFVTGSVVAVFLVVHINTFFIRSRFLSEGETMYELVTDAFAHPLYVAFYVIALGFLAFHLRHGFQSAFQTFGLRNPKFQRLIDLIAILFWLIVPLGFAAIPVYYLLVH